MLKDEKDGSNYSYLAEKRLDVTRFKKWNDNRGGVHNQQGKLQDDFIVNDAKIEKDRKKVADY